MRKIPFIIILLTVITAIALPCMAAASEHKNLLAQVHLEEGLRPGYAANIQVTAQGPQGRAAVGNIILQLIAGSLIYAAGPIAVLMIAVGGFRYVIAHGEQNQMDAAKKTITWAIIGLVVIIVSYAIVTNVIRIASTTEEQTAPTGQQPGQPQPAPPAGPVAPPAPSETPSETPPD